MNIRKNNGITLVVLVITIIFILIIAGISIGGTLKEHEKANDIAHISELNMVQHAILERYTKTKLTQDSLPGSDVSVSDVQSIVNEINLLSGENIQLKGTQYKRLSKEDLNEIGIKYEDDSFIVNYRTGEVINETLKVTPKSNKALYVYSKNET